MCILQAKIQKNAQYAGNIIIKIKFIKEKHTVQYVLIIHLFNAMNATKYTKKRNSSVQYAKMAMHIAKIARKMLNYGIAEKC